MIKIEKENIFVIGIAIILVIIAFAVIRNFIIPLIFTLILAYILNPAYKKVLKIIKNEEITSILFSIIILCLIIIPITLISLNLTKEINNIDDYNIVNNLDSINSKINEKYEVNINLVKQYDFIIIKIKEIIQNFFFKIPSYLFEIFLIIFFYYYFSKNYNHDLKKFKRRIDSNKFNFIKEEFEKLISGIIYGQIFVRFIQALTATLAFLVLGLNGAIISGIMIFFAAFMPVVGTGLIWIPLMIIKLINQEYFIAIMIFIIGIFISTIDNFLLPYIISEKTKMGPIITLISILGGIQLLGLYGIILGPFFVGILFILIEDIFEKIKISNPHLVRHTWTNEEREKYKLLKTKIAKEKFKEMINNKHSKSL